MIEASGGVKTATPLTRDGFGRHVLYGERYFIWICGYTVHGGPGVCRQWMITDGGPGVCRQWTIKQIKPLEEAGSHCTSSR